MTNGSTDGSPNGGLATRQITLSARGLLRALALIVALAAIASLVLVAYRAIAREDPLLDAVKPGSYQAVILSNGSLYFGRLRREVGDFYELTDVYFVRDERGSRRVTRLSEELHGPENRMLIKKSSVTVIEDLRADSQITRAIENLSG